MVAGKSRVGEPPVQRVPSRGCVDVRFSPWRRTRRTAGWLRHGDASIERRPGLCLMLRTGQASVGTHVVFSADEHAWAGVVRRVGSGWFPSQWYSSVRRRLEAGRPQPARRDADVSHSGRPPLGGFSPMSQALGAGGDQGGMAPQAAVGRLSLVRARPRLRSRSSCRSRRGDDSRRGVASPRERHDCITNVTSQKKTTFQTLTHGIAAPESVGAPRGSQKRRRPLPPPVFGSVFGFLWFCLHVLRWRPRGRDLSVAKATLERPGGDDLRPRGRPPAITLAIPSGATNATQHRSRRRLLVRRRTWTQPQPLSRRFPMLGASSKHASASSRPARRDRAGAVSSPGAGASPREIVADENDPRRAAAPRASRSHGAIVDVVRSVVAFGRPDRGSHGLGSGIRLRTRPDTSSETTSSAASKSSWWTTSSGRQRKSTAGHARGAFAPDDLAVIKGLVPTSSRQPFSDSSSLEGGDSALAIATRGLAVRA